jgi:small-conductance mechanosensitive channel
VDKIVLTVDFFLEHKLLLTVLIIMLISAIKRFIISSIRGDVAFLSDVQRKWMSRTKNGVFILILMIVFILWQAEVSKFALSVTAIAIALVIASKEIILCFTGSIQRASSRSTQLNGYCDPRDRSRSWSISFHR